MDAPFHPAVSRVDGEHHAFVCAHCGTAVEAVDELDRISCPTCGNRHRPDEWDDAYL